MFLQRIGQFSASRARAALVGRFPWSRAFLPGFHVLPIRGCFLNVLASFQRRGARPTLVGRFPRSRPFLPAIGSFLCTCLAYGFFQDSFGISVSPCFHLCASFPKQVYGFYLESLLAKS